MRGNLREKLGFLGCMGLSYALMIGFVIWLGFTLVPPIARSFSADPTGTLTTAAVLIAVVIGLGAIGVLLQFVSSDRVTKWLRGHVVTSGWMTLLFLVLLFAPAVLPPTVRTVYDPWRGIVIAASASLLYWFKHPRLLERAALIGCLVWLGFNAVDVLPGLRAYEAAEDAKGAYSRDLCYETENAAGQSVESCPIRPSSLLGFPFFVAALYLVAAAPDEGARSQARIAYLERWHELKQRGGSPGENVE